MVDVRDLGRRHGGGRPARHRRPTVEEIESFVRGSVRRSRARRRRADRPAGALESLACASQAAQWETVADFVVSQRQAAAGRGVPAERRDRGLAEAVALARRVSPHRGVRDVALAMLLRTGLPHTRAAFRGGRIDTFKATLVARETGYLSDEHRARVDEQLWGRP